MILTAAQIGQLSKIASGLQEKWLKENARNASEESRELARKAYVHGFHAGRGATSEVINRSSQHGVTVKHDSEELAGLRREVKNLRKTIDEILDKVTEKESGIFG